MNENLFLAPSICLSQCHHSLVSRFLFCIFVFFCCVLQLLFGIICFCLLRYMSIWSIGFVDLWWHLCKVRCLYCSMLFSWCRWAVQQSIRGASFFPGWLECLPGWLESLPGWLESLLAGWSLFLAGWSFFLAGFSLLFSHFLFVFLRTQLPLCLISPWAAVSNFPFERPLRALQGLLRPLEKSLVRLVGKEPYKVCNCAALEI